MSVPSREHRDRERILDAVWKGIVAGDEIAIRPEDCSVEGEFSATEIGRDQELLWGYGRERIFTLTLQRGQYKSIACSVGAIKFRVESFVDADQTLLIRKVLRSPRGSGEDFIMHQHRDIDITVGCENVTGCNSRVDFTHIGESDSLYVRLIYRSYLDGFGAASETA